MEEGTAMQCPGCGQHLRIGARFCDGCGAPLGDGGPPPGPPVAAGAALRPVTIMFCDLVGSAALAERFPPEDVRNLLGAYQQVCAEAIEAQGGHVARYVGDGLLVYFGYPDAHEDDPLRAVRAALAIRPAVGALHFAPAGQRVALQVRIGIESGLVLVEDIDGRAGRDRGTAVGTVPNIAARLQGRADPNQIVIGADTYARVRYAVDCRALGSVDLKGLARPLEIYEVLHERGEPDRFQERVARGLAPLVGREPELARLLETWQAARHGPGAHVHVVGDAGFGKSRLIQAFRQQLEGNHFNLVTYFCAAQHQSSALYPAIVQLERALAIGHNDGAVDRLARIRRGLRPLGLDSAQINALAVLLGALPAGFAPERQRREILAALVAYVVATAAQAPSIMVVEDLHWCDPSTQELLGRIAAALPGMSMLLLASGRPEFEARFAERVPQLTLSLGGLEREAALQLIRALSAGSALPPTVVARIAERTDGIPLYIEEFTRMVLESDTLRGTPAAGQRVAERLIPASLQSSLAERLNRLGPARRTAQVAAVFGRGFNRALLDAMPGVSSAEVAHDLERLAAGGFIIVHPEERAGEYEFSHALIRDAAYQSLLREDRRRLHLDIAETLVRDFPQFAAAHPEQVAHHYSEAGAGARAIDFWYQAGAGAIARSANLEAIAHLERGLGLLEELPAAERPLRELQLLMALTPALCGTRGYANAEVQRTFSRAYEICGSLGPSPDLSTVLYGLWSYYLVRAELARARRLAEEMRRVAELSGEPLRLMEGELAAGLVALYQGELATARGHFEHLLGLWSADGPQFFTAGEDIRASTKCWLALACWHQGELDLARDIAQQSLYRAREVGQPISLAFSLYFNVFLAHFCGDRRRVETLGQEGLALSTEHQLFWAALCMLQLGWARVDGAAEGADDDIRAGIEQIERGLGAFRGAGARLTQTYYLAMIAGGLLRLGEVATAERLVREAQAAAEETGERLWLPELRRLRGEIVQAGGEEPALRGERAEAHLEAALDGARTMGARSLELRAATSLARLWGEHGRGDAARALLEPLRGAFGLQETTADLAQADALLATLPGA